MSRCLNFFDGVEILLKVMLLDVWNDQIVKPLIDDYDILIQNSYLDLPNLKHKIEIKMMII